jgi:transcriptional regulator with XRE-family HTH domain
MYDTNLENLGKNIRYFRKTRNISTEDLGKAIHKSKATVIRYENNEILPDILTIIEICNSLNIDLNDLCDISMHHIESNTTRNPFDGDTLYLYYISKNGMIISSIEITQNNKTNYVLMKNGLTKNKYKQEYTGVMECSYNTAFFCLTNAINNPGLDKFQIEIDLHSKNNNFYYGIFLGVSDNTHKPTARKCILTNELITSSTTLSDLFEKLRISQNDIKDMVITKYWDLKTSNIKDYVIPINM